jgi:uncharacterized protein (DUF2132 family)
MRGNSYRDLEVWKKSMDVVVQCFSQTEEVGRMINGLRKSPWARPPKG